MKGFFMKGIIRFLPLFLVSLAYWSSPALAAQDWVHTGTNLSNPTIRIAAADFKPVGGDPQTPALKAVFDATLFNDLGNAGIFDLVSKSLAPQAMPGSPQEMVLSQWSAAPANAAMVAFGALSASNGRLVVYGWLFDTSNSANPQVLGKQYNEAASEDMARTVAHRFADEIIARLGGGINGIAETKIYFVSTRSGSKEIWAMDYDGQNQHQITHLGSISMSPRISPDNSRIAFSIAGPRRMGDPHVFPRPGPHGELSRRLGGRQQSIPGVVFRRYQACVFVVAIGRLGDLGGGRERRQPAPGYLPARTQRCTGLEPAHQRATGLCRRAHQRTADLHHGPGRRRTFSA